MEKSPKLIEIMEDLHLSDQSLVKSKELTKEEKAIISVMNGYSANHDGKINVERIEDILERGANCIIYNAGNINTNVDVGHELWNCGKERVSKMLDTLGLDSVQDGDEKASTLRAGYSAEETHKWAEAFLYTAKAKVRDAMRGGIVHYREFLNTLPYNNIYRLSNVLRMNNEVLKYTIKNGVISDFKDYMKDMGPGRNDRRNGYYPIGELTELYNSLNIANKKGKLNHFDKNEILKGISAINRDEDLTEKQKTEIRRRYIAQSLEFGADYFFPQDIQKIRENKYETVLGLLDVLDEKDDNPYKMREAYIENNVRTQKKIGFTLREIQEANDNHEVEEEKMSMSM